jgi:hypothetical protein
VIGLVWTVIGAGPGFGSESGAVVGTSPTACMRRAPAHDRAVLAVVGFEQSLESAAAVPASHGVIDTVVIKASPIRAAARRTRLPDPAVERTESPHGE